MTDSAYVDKLEQDNAILSRQISELQDEMATMKGPQKDAPSKGENEANPEQERRNRNAREVVSHPLFKKFRVVEYKNTFSDEAYYYAEIKRFGVWLTFRRWHKKGSYDMFPSYCIVDSHRKSEVSDWIYRHIYEIIEKKAKRKKTVV